MVMIIPTVGSGGYFKLRAPFDTLVLPNEYYTCQAVRRLSDYLANNEKPKEDIYLANSIPESEYDLDLKNDAYIVSLQAGTGHWVYVPASYVISYPIVNGIPYRTMMIGVSLPALPVERDLSFVKTAIENLVRDSLGVDSVTKIVETSKVVLVSKEKHDITQSQRDAIASGVTTDRSRYTDTLTKLDQALQKIQILETYIESL